MDLLGEVFARVAAQIREDPVVRATVRLQAERSQAAEPMRMPYVDWITTSTALFQTAAGHGELRPGLDPAALARAAIAGFVGVQHVSGSADAHADVIERVTEWWAVMAAGIAVDGPDGADDHGS